ncbi:MAG: histidine triad nucleotide-binding protein [Ornithinimicrobium sp.]
MSNCIFCKIAVGEIPAEIVHQGETAVAFRDSKPAAAVHVLVVPKDHHESLADMAAVDAQGVADLWAVVGDVARSQGIEDSGYRVLTNVGADAGQEVAHLHLHVMGGQPLGPLLNED